MLALPAAAQSPGYSAHAASRGYFGFNLGRSNYDTSCGSGAFVCGDSATASHLYGGNMVSDRWGVELGYLNMGRIDRGGGTTRAHGLNLSLVGKMPLSQAVDLYGKVGTTYGRTETSAAAGSGVTPGSDSGFGLSYGAGVSYAFTPKVSATLGWDSHDFHFAGGHREPVRMTSVGLQYRY
ncbi:MAG: outer membrane beta-barrel protein [Ramlibacter sp.]|nr:outer membrane beta-barrel protein [Ramlibacter sp.]